MNSLRANTLHTLASFASTFPLEVFEQHKIIARPYEESYFVYYILEGLVRQYDLTSSGEDITLNMFKNGAVVTAQWVLSSAPNRYYFEAAQDLKVHKIPTEDFYTYLQTNPKYTLQLLTNVISGIDGVMQRLSVHMQGNAKDRFLTELIIEAKRFSNTANKDTATLHIHVKDLSARCGMARETVSRQLGALKSLQLISKDNDAVYIPSISKLEEQLQKSS